MSASPPPGSAQVPAYLRIAATLRARIDSGALVPGDPLPPERDLCVEHGVSRMTARRALGILEREGLVYRDATRGTFVAEPRIPLRLGSFTREIERAGRHAEAEVFFAEQRAADAQVAGALGLAEGEPVYAIQRLRRSDGEPLALETSHYPAALLPGLLDGDLTGSLWAELRLRYGIALQRSVAALEVVVADAVTSGHLGIREAAGGLRLTRRTFDAEGRCVEFAQDVYRADRVSLVLERTIDDEITAS